MNRDRHSLQIKPGEPIRAASGAYCRARADHARMDCAHGLTDTGIQEEVGQGNAASPNMQDSSGTGDRHGPARSAQNPG